MATDPRNGYLLVADDKKFTMVATHAIGVNCWAPYFAHRHLEEGTQLSDSTHPTVVKTVSFRIKRFAWVQSGNRFTDEGICVKGASEIQWLEQFHTMVVPTSLVAGQKRAIKHYARLLGIEVNRSERAYGTHEKLDPMMPDPNPKPSMVVKYEKDHENVLRSIMRRNEINAGVTLSWRLQESELKGVSVFLGFVRKYGPSGLTPSDGSLWTTLPYFFKIQI